MLNGIDFGSNAGPTLLYVSSDLGQSLAISPITGVATVLSNYTGAPIDALSYNYLTGGFIGVSGLTHDLYSLNPATGSTSLIGPSGVDFIDRIGLDSIADTGIVTVPEPTAAAFMAIDGGLAIVLLRRRKSVRGS